MGGAAGERPENARLLYCLPEMTEEEKSRRVRPVEHVLEAVA